MKDYLEATCEVESWTKLQPGQQMMMELKASIDPIFFWDSPLLGNFPLWIPRGRS